MIEYIHERNIRHNAESGITGTDLSNSDDAYLSTVLVFWFTKDRPRMRSIEEHQPRSDTELEQILRCSITIFIIRTTPFH